MRFGSNNRGVTSKHISSQGVVLQTKLTWQKTGTQAEPLTTVWACFFADDKLQHPRRRRRGFALHLMFIINDAESFSHCPAETQDDYYNRAEVVIVH